jgi:hypothetical protein
MELNPVSISLGYNMLAILAALLHLPMGIQEQINRDPVMGQLVPQGPCFLKTRMAYQPGIRHCDKQIQVGIRPGGATGAGTE